MRSFRSRKPINAMKIIRLIALLLPLGLLAAPAQAAKTSRHEPYGTVVVLLDLYGNKWDLIGPVMPS